jgi:hypothetical protein
MNADFLTVVATNGSMLLTSSLTVARSFGVGRVCFDDQTVCVVSSGRYQIRALLPSWRELVMRLVLDGRGLDRVISNASRVFAVACVHRSSQPLAASVRSASSQVRVPNRVLLLSRSVITVPTALCVCRQRQAQME